MGSCHHCSVVKLLSPTHVLRSWRPGSGDRAWSQPPERGYFDCLLQETMWCIAGVQTEEGSRVQGAWWMFHMGVDILCEYRVAIDFFAGRNEVFGI